MAVKVEKRKDADRTPVERWEHPMVAGCKLNIGLDSKGNVIPGTVSVTTGWNRSANKPFNQSIERVMESNETLRTAINDGDDALAKLLQAVLTKRSKSKPTKSGGTDWAKVGVA